MAMQAMQFLRMVVRDTFAQIGFTPTSFGNGYSYWASQHPGWVARAPVCAYADQARHTSTIFAKQLVLEASETMMKQHRNIKLRDSSSQHLFCKAPARLRTKVPRKTQWQR